MVNTPEVRAPWLTRTLAVTFYPHTCLTLSVKGVPSQANATELNITRRPGVRLCAVNDCLCRLAFQLGDAV